MLAHFSFGATRLSSSAFRFAATVVMGAWLSMLAVDALAQSKRPYQMGILGSTDGTYVASSDIPIYWRTHAQPTGRSIIWLAPDEDPDQYNIDWARIVAVYVDEPYIEELPDSSDCNVLAFNGKRNKLINLAATVREKAPRARFWVNFRTHDIDLINRGCPLHGAFIDVISMDVYGVEFDSAALKQRYYWLYNYHRAAPYQQIALIAGTFTGGYQHQTAADGAARLLGFLDYANTLNQYCHLPLGPVGRTGIYDECPVWMVAGFLGGVAPHSDKPGDPAYYPIDNPASALVFNAWQAAFAVPRIDPVRVRQARKMIPLLSDE